MTTHTEPPRPGPPAQPSPPGECRTPDKKRYATVEAPTPAPPSVDGPEYLHARLTAAHQLLEDVDLLLGCTHRQAARHDVLGENYTCAGCALASKIRAHLEER